MTTIPDDEATAAIRRCRSITELASLTTWWRANNQTISPAAMIVMDAAQRTLWQVAGR